jgi:hypothetical protein
MAHDPGDVALAVVMLAIIIYTVAILIWRMRKEPLP